MASDVEMFVTKTGSGGSVKQANATKQTKEKAPDPGSSKKIIQYTRDQLLELASAPQSNKKPKCFVENPKLASLSCLRGSGKPARQKKGGAAGGGRERSDTPSDEAERRGAAASSSASSAATGPATSEHKKSAADPRERLKAEEDGLVLSPQRRSFTTGCQAPSNKPKEEDGDREVHRELPARRIGSGRIASREDGRGRVAGGRFDRFDSRLEKPDHRDRFDEKRGERRSGFGRDWVSGSGGGGFGREPPPDVRGYQPAGGGRRQRAERPVDRRGRADDEPEWFSAGPTSQHDMVELHGFGDEGGEETADEPPPEKPDKPAKQQPAAATAPVPKPQPAAPAAAAAAEQEPAEPAPPRQRPSDPPFLDDPAIQSTIQHHRPPAPPLDLDDILRWDIDSLPLDAVGGGGGSGGGASIGFSRWFRRESSPPPAASAGGPPPAGAANDAAGERRSSLQDELVGNILNGLEDLSLKIPASEPDAYFAPISPAHSGDKMKGDILSMLQRAPQPSEDAVNLAVKLAAMGGKTHNVADLEAAVRPDLARPQPQENQDAFRRLMSQLRASESPADRHKAPPPLPSDPFSQILNKAAVPHHQQQQPQQQQQPPLVRPSPLQPGEPRPVTPASSQHLAGPGGHTVTQDNLMKLLHMQQQQEHRRREQQQHQQHQQHQQQQQQLEQQQQQQQMAVHNLQQLLTMQRAASPAPSPLEQLMAIPEARNILIGLQNGRLSRQNLIQQLHNQVLQPRLREIIVAVLRLPQRVSPLPEPLQAALRAPAAQHLGVSAVPPPHRVPSPQEIRVHTQQILQQALIKRKLEEQKENFRKRQENRGKSPLPDGTGSDGDRRRPPNTTPASLAFTPTAVIRNMKAEARGSPEHRPKGRPLVKTNQDGPPPQAAAMSAGNIQSVAAKLLETQAQLHHQQQQQQQPWLRTAAAAGRPPQLAANPLARWFSPELLASAPRADLPPAVQQRVLSVEELERHQVMN